MGFADIVDAQRLCTLARLRNGEYSDLLFPALALLAGFAGAAFPATGNGSHAPNWSIIVAGGLVAFGLFALHRLYLVSQMALRFQASGPTTCIVTDQGVQMESTTSTGLQPWPVFDGYVNAPGRILLLYKRKAFANITKSDISAAEATQLLAIVSRNLRPL